jgi:hypothetical protein
VGEISDRWIEKRRRWELKTDRLLCGSELQRRKLKPRTEDWAGPRPDSTGAREQRQRPATKNDPERESRDESEDRKTGAKRISGGGKNRIWQRKQREELWPNKTRRQRDTGTRTHELANTAWRKTSQTSDLMQEQGTQENVNPNIFIKIEKDSHSITEVIALPPHLIIGNNNLFHGILSSLRNMKWKWRSSK